MLKFKCERKWLRETYTISDYSFDNGDGKRWQFLCNILELPVGNNKSMVEAIPYGLYTFNLSVSKNPKIHYTSPLLNNVPGRQGIRQHIGNWPEDTEGCQLIGLNKVKGGLTDSTITFQKYMRILQDSCQDEWSLLIC